MEFYKKLEKESIMKTKRKEKEKSEAARKKKILIKMEHVYYTCSFNYKNFFAIIIA